MDKKTYLQALREIDAAITRPNTGDAELQELRLRFAGILMILDRTTGAKELITAANNGNQDALYWIRRIERYGITESLMVDIARILKNIPIRAQLVLNRKDLTFRYEHTIDEPLSGIERIYALVILDMIRDGALDGLKRCELNECRKYFIGNAKARYCHDNCGAKVRARAMRRRNKAAQMMHGDYI